MPSDDQRAQYNQTSEDRRQFDRFIWQLPALSFLITGGLLTLVYNVLEKNTDKAAILLLCLAWNIAVLVFFTKNYYFLDLAIQVLTVLEARMEVPIIVRRHTKLEKQKKCLENYAEKMHDDERINVKKEIYGRDPKWSRIETVTVWWVFIGVMIATIGLLGFLFIQILFPEWM